MYYYTERIEKRGMTPLVNLLQELGNWPIATTYWNEKNFQWQKLISEIGRKLAVNTVLTVYVHVDKKDTSRNIIMV